MASKSTGKLQIYGDSDSGDRSTGGAQQQQQQQQQRQQRQQAAEISDDEEGSTSDDIEITFSGIDAVKICHFCKSDLENLGKYYHAKVTKEPPEGSLKKVIITGDKKYAADIKTNVDTMKDDLRNLTEEVVKLIGTKIDEVKELRRKYDEKSGVLVHISPMDFKVYVIGNGYEKMNQALHQVKVALGLISTSTRSGRQTESSGNPKGTNKLYPELSRDGRTEEDMDTTEYDARGASASGRDPAGTNVVQPYNKPRRYQRERERSPYDKYSNKTGQYGSSNDDDEFNFSYTFDSGFVLKVYKESITKVKVDSIVNAANDNLMHGGGVARVISKAAGYKLDEESNRYVEKRGFLKVGENCLTTAGNLPYKSVIHAVGPQWHDYRNKEECLRDLHTTVYKVLKRSQKESYGTVAMSAISAGIYAVPKELCADMYVQAVVDFIHAGSRYPKELHIIDIDTSILKLIEVSCKKWEKDPRSTYPAEALKQYLKQNPYAAGYTGQGQGHGRGRRAQRQFSEPVYETEGMFDVADALKGLSLKNEGTIPLKWGGKDAIFDVNGSLKVHIYTGKIDIVANVDAVVCSIDTGFGTNGYIVRAFRDAFGEKYKKNFEKMKAREKNIGTNNYVYTCETGSIYAPNVMHLAMKPLLRGSKDELGEYKTGIINLLNRAERKGFGKIAVPLLGTGNVQTRPDVVQSCGRCVLEAIRDFCCNTKSKHLTQVHLVNNKEEITQSMRSLFEDAEKGQRRPEKPRVRRPSSCDSEETIRDNEQFEKARIYRSLSSSVTDKSEMERFDSFTRGRVGDDREEPAPDYSTTIQPGAVGGQQQADDMKPAKEKKKGNLKIIEDD